MLSITVSSVVAVSLMESPEGTAPMNFKYEGNCFSNLQLIASGFCWSICLPTSAIVTLPRLGLAISPAFFKCDFAHATRLLKTVCDPLEEARAAPNQ